MFTVRSADQTTGHVELFYARDGGHVIGLTFDLDDFWNAPPSATFDGHEVDDAWLFAELGDATYADMVDIAVAALD